jgi:hypothetical protein
MLLEENRNHNAVSLERRNKMKKLNLTLALTTCLVLLTTGLAAQTDGPRYDESENLGYLEITIQTNDRNYVIQGLAEDNPGQWPVICTDPGGGRYSEVIRLIEEDAEFIFGGTVSFDGGSDYEIYMLKPHKFIFPHCIDCPPTYDADAIEGEVLDGDEVYLGGGKYGHVDREARESEADFADLVDLSTKKPDIDVFIESTGPTIVPRGSGDLAFKTGVLNNEDESVIGDLWFVVQEPSGNEFVVPGNILQHSDPILDQEILPGFYELDDNVLTVPVSVVTGKYSLKVRVGKYSDITIDEDSFDFYVTY